ncbi:unnamed protein product [Lactuca virosa]|uniref:START domain-containing protein n=1 Tax=Lactuca virosa TaxID=75947 RepID=A0AAU9MLE7_9ASTR|nr:unnamed protein product [Lactuca virosa]
MYVIHSLSKGRRRGWRRILEGEPVTAEVSSFSRVAGRNEERNPPSDAMDLICNPKWAIDACYDDQNTPSWKSLSLQSKTPDG